jgi:UDP-glucose 4-epimerase
MGHTVAVLGANGFIGQAVAARLRESGAGVRAVPAPRLEWKGHLPTSTSDASAAPDPREVERLAELLDGSEVVINAAGIADADASGSQALYGANSLMPLLVARAAAKARVRRFLHLSSVVVQGTSALDETARTEPFSPYSLSRALGEALLLRDPQLETVIYRPSPVQGPHKPNTRAIIKIARSPLACVAGDGSRPTPQALAEEVSSAIAFTALLDTPVPPILLHPHNGMTTGMLLSLLGGKEPRHLPLRATRFVVNGILAGARSSTKAYGNARRLEMLLLGREQAPGWLRSNGFLPQLEHGSWTRLGRQIATENLLSVRDQGQTITRG